MEYAAANGAEIVEAYPKDRAFNPEAPVETFTGLMSTFEKEGFREAARRSENRPIMRKAASAVDDLL